MNGDHAALLGEINDRIRSAQYQALKAVNNELISLYWNVGQLIIERQQGATWGQFVVQQLAKDIREPFPGIRGFSAANLWRVKPSYEAYAGSERLAPMVREIGWSHNIIILEKCKDDLEREFCLRWQHFLQNDLPAIRRLLAVPGLFDQPESINQQPL